MQTEQKNPEHAVPEFQACRKPIGFTISIGVAAWSGQPEELAVLMNRSDGALSRAKEEGRNRVCTA
jgi:PleD family two-component response regulator